MQTTEVAEEEVTTGVGEPMEMAEGVGEHLRNKGCARTARRMQLLSSVPIAFHHWFFVMTVQLCSTGGQQEEITC